MALPGIHHRPRPAPASSVALAGHQPADLGAPGGVEGRRRRLDRGVAQPVRHRGEREPPRSPETLAARDHGALQLCHRGGFGHQAGLADARPAADQREAAAARGRGPPRLLELAELGGPAKELRRGQPRPPGLRPARLGGPGRRACVGHQALEHFACRGVRDDAQLTLQHRSAVVVGADGAGPVAQLGLQLHQGAVADLLQRLQLNPAARHIHRPGQVTAPHPPLAEQVAQAHTLPLDLRPGVEQPVLIPAGQQVAPVLGDGAGRMSEDPLVIADGRRRQRRLALDAENAQVDAARLGVAPAQIHRRHDQRRLVAQHLAQLMQLAAQVRQGLRVCRVRPEQAGDPLPQLGCPGVRGQERDQGDGPRRACPDPGPVPPAAGD